MIRTACIFVLGFTLLFLLESGCKDELSNNRNIPGQPNQDKIDQMLAQLGEKEGLLQV